MSCLLPVIDFGACSISSNDDINKSKLEKAGRGLVDALSNIGCAYITNSGVEVDSVFKATEKFFQCRKEDKDKFAFDINAFFGYVGIETETFYSNPPDYKEGFSADGPQVFQHSNNWPDDLSPGFSGTVKRFMNDCKKFGFRVLESLSIGLSLKEESFLTHYHKYVHQDGNATVFKSTYYPALTKELKPGQLRHAEHTDLGTITLIFQDGVGGLQFEYEGEFIDIPPLNGSVVVLAGDIFSMQTCGQIKAATHRVVLSEKGRNMVRQSVQYFIVPDDDVVATEPLLFEDEKKNELNKKHLRPTLMVSEYGRKREKKFA